MIWWQNIAELIELLWPQAKKALYSAGVKNYLYKVLTTDFFMFEKVSENSDLTLQLCLLHSQLLVKVLYV
jgi:hypothetical protein